MKLRRPAKSFILASIFLFSLALFLTSASLAYLAIFPLLMLAIPAPPFSISVVESRIPENCRVGDEVEVQLRFRVLGFGLFKLMHELPESFELADGSNAKAKFVLFSSSIVLSYKAIPRKRGEFDLGKVFVEVESIFASFIKKAEIDLGAKLEVRSRIYRVRRIELKRGIARKPMPEIDISQIGTPSTDFREIRKYVAGDPLKFINWKATARIGELMVNEYEREGRKAIWIFVDANPYMMHGRAAKNCFETAVELASSLCYYFAVRGHKVGLYVVGHKILLYPESGRRQFRKAFEILTKLDVSNTVESFDSAVEAMKKYIEALKPASIFITRVEFANIFNAVVKAMGGRRLPVAVVSIYGEKYEGLAYDVTRILRSMNVARLRRMGVDVYEIEAGKSVDRLLARVAR